MASPSERLLLLTDVLDSCKLPKFVVATRDNDADTPFFGAEMSVHHHQWLFEKVRDKSVIESRWVKFDRFVEFPRISLKDAVLREDYFCKKILIINAAKSSTSPGQMAILDSKYDAFIRWRLFEGIRSNENLSRRYFDIYFEKLLNYSLHPIDKTINRVFDLVEDKIIDLELFRVQRERSVVFFWSFLAEYIGTTESNLSNSLKARNTIADRLGQIGSSTSSQLLSTIKRKSGRTQGENFSQDTLEHHLSFWSLLDTSSSNGIMPTNRLSFNPFEFETAKEVARRLGTKKSRTPTIHPDDFYRILTASAKWFFDYADYILGALQQLYANPVRAWQTKAWKAVHKDLDRKRPPSAPKLYFAWTAGSSVLEDRITVADAVRYLVSACAITVACLTPRRGGEIEGLLLGCVSQDRIGLYALTIYIEKTLQQTTKVPIPYLAARAVSVIERIASMEPKLTEEIFPAENLLFRRRYTKGNYIAVKLNNFLRGFLEYVKVPAPEGATSWEEIASHQLRRGFAIFHCYGNEWAVIDDVTYALFHLDSEISRIYVTEVMPGESSRFREELKARFALAKNLRSENYAREIEAFRDELQVLEENEREFYDTCGLAYVQKMLRLHHRTDTVIGKAAKVLYGDLHSAIESAMADIRVGSQVNNPEALETALIPQLKALAMVRSLRPIPGGPAHCIARDGNDDDMAKAKCLSVKAMSTTPWSKAPSTISFDKIDFGFSGAYICLGCDHCAALGADQIILGRKVNTLESVVAQAHNPSAKHVAARKLEQFKARLSAAKADAEGLA